MPPQLLIIEDDHDALEMLARPASRACASVFVELPSTRELAS